VPPGDSPTSVELREHEQVEVTAHLLRNQHVTIGRLSDTDLVEELLVAAMVPDHGRLERFNELLAERERRARVP